MDLNEYQKKAKQTAVFPKESGLAYTALGLVGEAGEFANKVKKTIRGDGALDRFAAADELGDVLWYVAAAAAEIGFDLDTVAWRNITKLEERKLRGMLKGSGDTR